LSAKASLSPDVVVEVERNRSSVLSSEVAVATLNLLHEDEDLCFLLQSCHALLAFASVEH
jgi:hypothetical protein